MLILKLFQNLSQGSIFPIKTQDFRKQKAQGSIPPVKIGYIISAPDFEWPVVEPNAKMRIFEEPMTGGLGSGEVVCERGNNICSWCFNHPKPQDAWRDKM